MRRNSLGGAAWRSWAGSPPCLVGHYEPLLGLISRATARVNRSVGKILWRWSRSYAGSKALALSTARSMRPLCLGARDRQEAWAHPSLPPGALDSVKQVDVLHVPNAGRPKSDPQPDLRLRPRRCSAGSGAPLLAPFSPATASRDPSSAAGRKPLRPRTPRRTARPLSPGRTGGCRGSGEPRQRHSAFPRMPTTRMSGTASLCGPGRMVRVALRRGRRDAPGQMSGQHAERGHRAEGEPDEVERAVDALAVRAGNQVVGHRVEARPDRPGCRISAGPVSAPSGRQVLVVGFPHLAGRRWTRAASAGGGCRWSCLIAPRGGRRWCRSRWRKQACPDVIRSRVMGAG
ncbi:hypothetical protein G443_001166 [Actinoalloteichus cyanogriseus DSM 43889]|uniref:Uncharacterized protein n=1 Tax=Actinoalloteichus caeruleus DSM 43889 TaxID=1120930 RepID=A0ABT1JGJ2_ACTCY|nr:hypothetical protein [Actinoalloteichus caeruleus DSM 43889]